MAVTSDEIRQFVRDAYIDPARKAGQREIDVRAGEVHSRMHLKSAMPHVCSAIGAIKFLAYARVMLLRREGPQNGGNMVFTFEVLP